MDNKMQVQQKYTENRSEEDRSISAEKFCSKTLSVKGQGLGDGWWESLSLYDSVEILILDENEFTSFPKNILKQIFPKLKVLSAKRNKFCKLSIEAFDHPLLEIIDLENNELLTDLYCERKTTPETEDIKEEEGHIVLSSISLLNLQGTNLEVVDKEFFHHMYMLEKLQMHGGRLCGGCGFEFLGYLGHLQSLKVTGVKTSSCSACKTDKNAPGFSLAVAYSIYNMVCKMSTLVELDLSGKSMSIDYFMFLTPLPNLSSLRMQGRLVRDMSLRDWPGILKSLRHLSLGVIDNMEEDLAMHRMYGESTFYAEKILEATNLESLSFDSVTLRRIKFSLGTRKVVFPHLRHLTIRNCDLRPLTFFNKENAPALESLEIISTSFTEGYFYTIKKRLGNRLRCLRIGIERMDAPQAIYDLFTFIRSHQNLECLHLNVCETITESQSFYKYFSDKPTLKELYVMGRMNIHRMKRFLSQLGQCTSLETLLLDIESPAAVLTYFCPLESLTFFSLKSSYAPEGKPALPVHVADLESLGQMPHLLVLDLSGCGLETFPAGILQKLSSLEQIYLNNNNISHISDEVIAFLHARTEHPLYVDISCNPLNKKQIEKSLINGTWLGKSGMILY
ncbi:hypothetical protein NECID01_1093 [Nematocida sp. AWRm77]|nr:hypothetical protein NECID01_1093 [Nematocida sp. AWRm77]